MKNSIVEEPSGRGMGRNSPIDEGGIFIGVESRVSVASGVIQEGILGPSVVCVCVSECLRVHNARVRVWGGGERKIVSRTLNKKGCLQ